MIENVNSPQLLTQEEEQCEEIFSKTHYQDKNGRYVVKIPFNDKLYQLGESRKIALKQFYMTKNKMKKNPEFGNKYRESMREYETLGHMKQLNKKNFDDYYTSS